LPTPFSYTQKSLLEQKGRHSDIPQRASLSPAARTPPTNRPIPDDLLEEDESYYPVRSASSAIRYQGVVTQAPTSQRVSAPQEGEQRDINGVPCVWSRGQWHRLRVHDDLVPLPNQQRQTEPVIKQRYHWLYWVGLCFCTMLLGWLLLTALSGWIQQKRDDITYQNPRIFQIDANVGHYGRVSHFVALNLHGYIEIFEIQERHPEVAKIYTPTALLINPTDPVILSFQDVTGRGKLDMIITAPSFQEVMFNNGTSFQSQPPNH
jgi:hypothetical protein